MSVDIQEMAEEILAGRFLHFARPIFLSLPLRLATKPLHQSYAIMSPNTQRTPNRGPYRHYITLPFEPPLYNPCFFDDNTVIAIASQMLGEDLVIDQYASDTPLKGSVYQEIHGDVGPLFRENPDFQHPPAILAVNFPFY